MEPVSIFQGRAENGAIEQFTEVPRINEYFASPNADASLRLRLDEQLNFLKVEEYLLRRGFRTFHLRLAPSKYYQNTLGCITRNTPSVSQSTHNRPSLQDNYS